MNGSGLVLGEDVRDGRRDKIGKVYGLFCHGSTHPGPSGSKLYSRTPVRSAIEHLSGVVPYLA